MSLVRDGRWFSEKYGDIIKSDKIPGDNKNPLEKQEILSDFGDISPLEKKRGEKNSLKVGDINSLKDVIKESINEGIKEALKDLVVKEVKKKKDKVVKTEGTSPKKGKKASPKGEISAFISGVVLEEGEFSKKKDSTKKELAIKEEVSNKEVPNR